MSKVSTNYRHGSKVQKYYKSLQVLKVKKDDQGSNYNLAKPN